MHTLLHLVQSFADACSSTNNSVNLNCLPHVDPEKAGTVHTILQITIGVTAALSLLFITIGGLRYILSKGDPQGVSKAKGTIVYALVGLVVAIVAQAIVSFVLVDLGK